MGLGLLALLLAVGAPPGKLGGTIEVAVAGVRSAAGHTGLCRVQGRQCEPLWRG